MKTDIIIKQLKGLPKIHVEAYIAYLDKLYKEERNGRRTNYWLADNLVSETQLADAFKKVASEGLFIDGEIITISYKKKLTIDYSYHAYRKKLTATYPETVIDAQVVYKDDKFSFAKESGKVIYSHEMGNPFHQKSTDIIGAYCVVKNRSGEFIELISIEEAEKMRSIARTKNVWDTWTDRMYLKSAIKRLCKTFFHDTFNAIEGMDNENYSFELIDVPEEKQEAANKRAEIRHYVTKLSANLKEYKRADKMALKDIYLQAHEKGTVTLEFVNELCNRVEYGNLLERYTGEDKEMIEDAFNTTEVITNDVLLNFKELVNG